MPWSDWFAGRPVEVGIEQAYLVWDSRLGDAVSSYPSGRDYLSMEDVGQSWDAEGQQTVRKGWQFQPASDWLTYRDWFPPDLYGMQEGVDYAVRPDRTADDTDSYIQYEGEDQPYDVDATARWAAPTFRPSYVNGQDGSTSPDMAVTWEVSCRVGTSFPTQVGALLSPWPGHGTALGAATTRVFGSDVEVPIGDPPLSDGVLSFALLAEVTQVESFTPQPPAVATLNAYFSRPRFYAVPPRWRYWMPGDVAPIPLRQRQRDDGLGSSTIRARGVTSRQRSIRQRSYF